MRLTRFEPWPYADFWRPETRRNPGANAGVAWIPAVDILEEKERFVLRADLPGVKADDIDINMDAGVLTITGKRQAIADDDVAEVRRSERKSGDFRRRFTLPDTADAENVAAKSRDGILEVSIAKLPEVQARRITVEAA